MMRPFLCAVLASAFLVGCSSNYFSNYETVYRIETSNGDHYYTESKPKLDGSGVYNIEDLDGNEYQVKKSLMYKIEKYRHKK